MKAARKKSADRARCRWTDEEDALLGTMTDSAAAAKLERTRKGCEHRRKALRRAAYRPHARDWNKRELKLLGRRTDHEVAAQLGCSRKHVIATRRRLGIPAAHPTVPRKKANRWSQREKKS
ncbi:MAG: hypothetical protein AB7O62_00330 [Pirellulales bacterium]